MNEVLLSIFAGLIVGVVFFSNKITDPSTTCFIWSDGDRRCLRQCRRLSMDN